MELFVFDRAGAYSSGKFSIHDEPDKFARAIVGYLTMTHEDMGIDTFIKRLSEDVISLCDTAGKETKFTLEQLLSTSRRTTCFSTENYAKAVKFSWTSEGGAQEADLLILAEERGVKGVPRLVAYNRKTSIAELRQDLEFPRPKLNKRKLPALLSDSDSGDDCHRYKWRRCSDWEMPGEYDGPPPGLTESSEKPFINKIYNCLVVAPYGRPISNFESAMELLESMRDAIRAHESLYVKAGILHRDVSPSNILITKPDLADGYKGILIDLDHTHRCDAKMTEKHIGTLPFMAVGLLLEKDHTYRLSP
ncbi:serine/threonine-protein kinase Sgk2 [Ophiocordyceps camponoti-floridani]|uniref:non-specific serine/threonine protein kinase n=1 Tax=Ophiocordyceps camponoti-floridani TaxID=2030778 RepID=A0A8H4Q0H1_9HYPO|nr:serine/threonine-protein kinase Sgk2 [Ophiocordyceps camponoti-floridani]